MLHDQYGLNYRQQNFQIELALRQDIEEEEKTYYVHQEGREKVF